MTELAPGWILQTEESNDHHWIGSCGELVMVFAYEGSHDDVRHVHVGARVIERVATERRAPGKFLFVLPPHHSKPPDARVRSAIASMARRLEGRVERASVVVSGTGFGAAVHRGAIAGVLTVLRPKVPVKVVGSVRDGLTALLDAASPAFTPLLRHCEERAQGPSATTVTRSSGRPREPATDR